MISEEKLDLLPEAIANKVRELIKAGKVIDSVYKLEVDPEITRGDSYVLDDTLDNPYIGYLRNPDSRTMSLAISKMVDPFDAGKAFIANCWLGGDEELRSGTNETVKSFANLYAAGLLRVHKGKLTEL